MKTELELGTHKQLTVAAELDHDNELELHLDTPDCDYGNPYAFLPVEDLKALRDHIDKLLQGI